MEGLTVKPAPDRSDTTDRDNWCLHPRHPDPAIEERAEEIYLWLVANPHADWRAVETPETWWSLAELEIRMERTL